MGEEPIIIIGALAVNVSADSWTKLNTGTLSQLHNIASINSMKALAVGENGTIIRTTDGGSTWYSQHSSSGAKSLFGLSVADSINIALGESGVLMYCDSVNTGKPGVWTNVVNVPYSDTLFSVSNAKDTSFDSSNLYYAYQHDIKTFYVVGKQGIGQMQVHYIETTQYAGTDSFSTTIVSIQAFLSANIPTTSLRSVLLHNNTIYVVGNNGMFVRSTNSGLTWSNKIIDSATTFSFITFINSSSILAVGDSGKMWLSTDRGDHWINKRPAGLTDNIHAISFIDSSGVGVAVGDHGLIIKTTDGGMSWKRQACNVFANLNSVSLYNGDNGFGASWLVAGDSGTILQCVSGGDTVALADISASINSTPWQFGSAVHENFGTIQVNGKPVNALLHYNSQSQYLSVRSVPHSSSPYFSITPNLNLVPGGDSTKTIVSFLPTRPSDSVFRDTVLLYTDINWIPDTLYLSGVGVGAIANTPIDTVSIEGRDSVTAGCAIQNIGNANLTCSIKYVSDSNLKVIADSIALPNDSVKITVRMQHTVKNSSLAFVVLQLNDYRKQYSLDTIYVSIAGSSSDVRIGAMLVPALTLYPNPALRGETVNLNLPFEFQSAIKIFDEVGRMVFTTKSSSINTSLFPGGIYWILGNRLIIQ